MRGGVELLDNECVEHETSACMREGYRRRPSWPRPTQRCFAPRWRASTTSGVRAECLATMQAEVVQLALDLLVREPDLEGFFGGLTRNMVEETESNSCSVWLIDHDANRCSLWLAYMNGQLYTSRERRPAVA